MYFKDLWEFPFFFFRFPIITQKNKQNFQKMLQIRYRSDRITDIWWDFIRKDRSNYTTRKTDVGKKKSSSFAQRSKNKLSILNTITKIV